MLFRAALDEIMDAAPPPSFERRIRRIASEVEEVRGIEKCRVRKSGLSVFADIHVEVDGAMTVERGHEIAHNVKDSLMNSDIGIVDVSVHIEPEGIEHEPLPGCPPRSSGANR